MLLVFTEDQALSDTVHVAIDGDLPIRVEDDPEHFFRLYGALEYPLTLVIVDCRGDIGRALAWLDVAISRMRGVPILAVVEDTDAVRAFEVGDRGTAGLIAAPFDSEMVRARIVAALGTASVLPSLVSEAPAGADRLVGTSRFMIRLRRLVVRAASSRIPVLILGETGVGKEIVAQEIHNKSDVADGPFVAANVAAIAPGVFESELFGSKRGAFTGAVDRKGLFQSAEGGTLFIDEVGELPRSLQPKLLRAVETGHVRPVGAASTEAVRTRIIAATNRTAVELQESGDFRRDLWYRLAGIMVPVPSLRDRVEDIRALAHAILREEGYNEVILAQSAIERLREHDWPGNVRELRAVLIRSVALSGKHRLRGRDIYLGCEDLEDCTAL